MSDENPNAQEVGIVFSYPITGEISLAITDGGLIILTNDGKPHPRAMVLGELTNELGNFNEACNWVINGIKAADKRI